MHARVTLLEIDTLRAKVDDLVEEFRRAVLPQLRAQPGYRGVYVLTTDEGKGLLVSLWDTAEQAGTDSGGWYTDTLAEYTTVFRSPPGRERYEVTVVDSPSSTGG